jgi:hypothetical protein
MLTFDTDYVTLTALHINPISTTILGLLTLLKTRTFVPREPFLDNNTLFYIFVCELIKLRDFCFRPVLAATVERGKRPVTAGVGEIGLRGGPQLSKIR